MFENDAVHAQYAVGIDYGSLSGRAVIANISNGDIIGEGVYKYPSAVMDETLSTPSTPVPLPPSWALQDPDDYIGVLKHAVPEAIKQSGVNPSDICGIGIDFTASTVLPVYQDGTPLCRDPQFRDRPHAWVKLWKHHAAQTHANRITELAVQRGETWLARYGGKISSEWQFAKALEIFEDDREIYDAMDVWIEAADWLVWQLCGNYTRNTCTAGYKGIFQDGSYPSKDFLEELSPGFGSFVSEKLEHTLSPLGSLAGHLTAEASSWTGLNEGIAVSVGNIDAHVTAPAANAVEPGNMVAIMGTSTCLVMSSKSLEEVPGMCGVVDGGIIDGQYGYEAGQSGVGDIFAWFIDNCVPLEYHEEAKEQNVSIFELLAKKAADAPVGASGLVALDWHSGNRSTLVDHKLSSVIVGLSLQTRPEEIYRALIEATAFGAKTIVDTFVHSGVAVNEFIAAGGLIKDPFLMQIYADILNMPISTIATSQGPALGSAIHAAVAAGKFHTVTDAAKKMGKRNYEQFIPNPQNTDTYQKLYEIYTRLKDFFGVNNPDLMHTLKDIQEEQHEIETKNAN
ncbi:MAG: ribulokinase [Actinomycetaceae bacterium]|nr:ribulokinase [Actinomycetaceae bacterium]